jgi:hypothetical protein
VAVEKYDAAIHVPIIGLENMRLVMDGLGLSGRLW